MAPKPPAGAEVNVKGEEAADGAVGEKETIKDINAQTGSLKPKRNMLQVFMRTNSHEKTQT